MSRLTDFLTGIANAIRGKTGETGSIPASSFAEKIAAIETGVDTSDATATESDVSAGKTFYGADGTKKTGTLEQDEKYNITIINNNRSKSLRLYVQSEITSPDSPRTISIGGSHTFTIRRFEVFCILSIAGGSITLSYDNKVIGPLMTAGDGLAGYLKAASDTTITVS